MTTSTSSRQKKFKLKREALGYRQITVYLSDESRAILEYLKAKTIENQSEIIDRLLREYVAVTGYDRDIFADDIAITPSGDHAGAPNGDSAGWRHLSKNDILLRIKSLRADKVSYQKIARQLESEKILTTLGKRIWDESNIRKMVKSGK